MGKIVDIQIAGKTYMGQVPMWPLCQLLIEESQKASGYTLADKAAAHAAKAAGKPLPPPTAPRDMYGSTMVGAAAVGLCWPEELEGVPSLRSLRHDVYEYGARVLEHLREKLGLTRRSATLELTKAGHALLVDMTNDMVRELNEEIEEERGFTTAQGASST